ncbi:MAG TPA: helix-turn-helix transcriptional regulator [Rugosimonospora sp.]|nr:helix-turn-helix transcriptional regulator [Rugosimonospora sp.]
MEIDEWAIGQRIASHRARRGLTQEELTGLVGISLSMMKKIESGDRLVTKFSQLVQFAQVLRVKDLRELTGVPLPLMPRHMPGSACHCAALTATVVALAGRADARLAGALGLVAGRDPLLNYLWAVPDPQPGAPSPSPRHLCRDY